ncbi:unnamed protein product [Ilex paraguariensis]|uniref:Mediator of RNA polymerase II transcription subunit 11 n=1 Tax=Ilex paraguariensis TaxID=185542 RepID=A0ABC8RLX2_9AQUA
MQQTPPHAAATPESKESSTEAPPKQVAQAMDRLAHAGRLIADIRLGADRLLEALFVSAQPHQSSKPLQLIVKEEASMRQCLQDLRTVDNQCNAFLQYTDATSMSMLICWFRVLSII